MRNLEDTLDDVLHDKYIPIGMRSRFIEAVIPAIDKIVIEVLNTPIHDKEGKVVPDKEGMKKIREWFIRKWRHRIYTRSGENKIRV